MPHGGKADCFKCGVHQACVLEAVTAPAVCDNFDLQAFGIETDRTPKEDVEAFERDACDVRVEDPGDGIEARCAGPYIVDPREIRVEV